MGARVEKERRVVIRTSVRRRGGLVPPVGRCRKLLERPVLVGMRQPRTDGHGGTRRKKENTGGGKKRVLCMDFCATRLSVVILGGVRVPCEG